MTIQHSVSPCIKKRIMCLGILLCSAWHMLNVNLNIEDVRPVLLVDKVAFLYLVVKLSTNYILYFENSAL